MSIISNTIIAFSMSMDAFAVAIGKGISLHKPSLGYAMRIGLIFGIVETVSPIIGWSIGLMAGGFISSIDHWIAFTILSLIGAKMIYEGFHKTEIELKQEHKISVLILTAIGTSIDSMAVGATLALLEANIWLMASIIGTATFCMSTLGIMMGHYLGTKAGKIAEVLGGLSLILIGTKILFEHLNLPSV
ncbi:manganese efflux pump MntP family protein [Candidatus Berkiella cookevillensis]|uniref:Putative manganese efflux pump MntP n=1 Tax=Candidatus Berkiella cookevillensis TaxID=437022 RepID=A0A0Q9YJM4_9GAMM|nr:manganese efflux pump MntP family protein [Candidatus Berkiella cookevillensis]MCS5708491.1 manganese efflux pump MntP family protein [Candidatus Berkiella cookevillensis]